MKYNKNYRRKNSLRSPGHNYKEPGFYFITIVTLYRKKLFGTIKKKTMTLNDYGKILHYCWRDLPNHYDNIKLHRYIIMPDHFHCIIEITHCDKHGIPEMIRALKTFSARRINELKKTPGTRIWHRSYHDHIIKDDRAFNNISNYIKNNINNLD